MKRTEPEARTVRVEAPVGQRPIVDVRLPDVGLGTMRTSGTLIGALLQMEGHDAVSVLVDAARTIGLELEDVIAEWRDQLTPND